MTAIIMDTNTIPLMPRCLKCKPWHRTSEISSIFSWSFNEFRVDWTFDSGPNPHVQVNRIGGGGWGNFKPED
jgi:hypothetical protein